MEEAPLVVAMAPKAKPKAKAKGGAKALAKVKARVRPPGGLRRPAHRGGEPGREETEEKWRKGEEIPAWKAPLLELGRGVRVVCTKALYYHQECKVAGAITGLEVQGGETVLLLQLRGTTHEGLLKLHSSGPLQEFRLHLCPPGCNQEEVSDFLIHALQMRLEQEEAAEEGWATNLQKVQPAEGTDDLAGLRERQQKLGVEAERPAVEKKEKSKKTKRKEKKEKKEKREKKDRLGLAVESSGSSEEVALDGSRARLAARKSLIALFAGTGLDPKEKIRRRVSQKARRAVKKRGKRSSDSSSGGSSGSTEDMGPEAGEEGVFQQESKVRLVAASQPGALAAQALTHMRGLLLSEIGHNDQPGLLKACAVAYYRQCLQRQSTGPAQSELLTICSAVDAAMSGNVAGCLDILLQRLKSAESTLSGTHWSVSQRLEILPQDQASLTPLQEMSSARKDVYEESRLKWLASQPDGLTGGGGSKGSGKTKSDSKDGAKGGDRGRRFGKGTPLKGEGNKKGKEDGAPKA